MKPIVDILQDLRKAPVTTEFREFATDIGGWFHGQLDRLSGQENRALAQSFQAWFKAEVSDPDLQEWIESLSDEGVEVLTEQVARFCRDFQIDLAWLVDGRLAADPELAAVASRVVLHYCSACMVALDHNDAIQRFRRFDERSRKVKRSVG